MILRKRVVSPPTQISKNLSILKFDKKSVAALLTLTGGILIDFITGSPDNIAYYSTSVL